MKPNIKSAIYIFLICGFVLSNTFVIGGRYLLDKYYSYTASKDVISTGRTPYSASEYMPAPDDQGEAVTPVKEASPILSLYESFHAKCSSLKKTVLKYADQAIIDKNDMTRLCMLTKKLSGIPVDYLYRQNSIYEWSDVMIEMPGGYLTYVIDDVDMSASIDKIIAFKNDMDAAGINFLYMEVPFKYDQTIYEGAIADCSDAKIEHAMQALRDSGVDVLSLTEEIRKDQLEKTSLFFKTDHHWLPQAGLWACRKTANVLNERYSYHIDPNVFSEEQYDIRINEKSFLGIQGEKVTDIYCERDDFPMIIPKYDTEFTVFLSYFNETKTGNMQDTLFNWQREDKYVFYTYGDQALIQIENHDETADDHHILVVKTSFANCMMPYLATEVSRLDMIDLRYFEGSLMRYIEIEKPDTVIFMYGIPMLFPEYYDILFDYNE